MIKRILIFVIMCSVGAFAQGYQRLGYAQTNSSGFVKILPGASIEVCAYNPMITDQCGPQVPIYQDFGLTIPASNPIISDNNGFYSYYVTPGNYTEYITSPGVVPLLINVSLGSQGTGTGTVTSVTGTAPIVVTDPTTTPVVSCPGCLVGPATTINAISACGLQGYPHDDTAALNACITNPISGGKAIAMPKLNPAINLGGFACDYLLSGVITFPKTTTTAQAIGIVGVETTSWNDGPTLCWTADTPGIRINTFTITLSGLTIANVGGFGWTRGTLSTFGVPTVNHGVQICGGRIHIQNASIYNWSGDGVHASSLDCDGSPTDYGTADKWQMDNVYSNGNKGYGLYAAGGDGGVGKWDNGECHGNQLGCFADVAQYGNQYLNIDGDSNGSDPLAAIGIKSITSCTVDLSGTATCAIPSHGFIQNDWLSIDGNSYPGVNTSIRYVDVIDADTVSFPCGCGYAGTGTGGTAGYLPGARIWATNLLYAGSLYTNNPVGVSLLQHVYMEGTNGPAAPGFAIIQDGQGFLSNPGGYYWANSGTHFARLTTGVGPINTVGAGPFSDFFGRWMAFGVNDINRLSGGRQYSYMFPGACSRPGANGYNNDCSWGAEDFSPYSNILAGHMDLGRYPHVTSAAPHGYWNLLSGINNGTDLANSTTAIQFTDNLSDEGPGYSRIPNGMLWADIIRPAPAIQAGERLMYQDTDDKLIHCINSSNLDVPCTVPPDPAFLYPNLGITTVVQPGDIACGRTDLTPLTDSGVGWNSNTNWDGASCTPPSSGTVVSCNIHMISNTSGKHINCAVYDTVSSNPVGSPHHVLCTGALTMGSITNADAVIPMSGCPRLKGGQKYQIVWETDDPALNINEINFGTLQEFLKFSQPFPTFNDWTGLAAQGFAMGETLTVHLDPIWGTPDIVQNCGTTTTCAHTDISVGMKMVKGSVPLSSGSPSTATVTGFSPAFTSSTSFVCTVSNATTQANPIKVVNASAGSITLTGPNTVTDTVNYICVGN